MLCFPMTLTVLATLWKPFGKPFKVSAKGDTKANLTFSPSVGVPLLVLLALYIFALIYAFAHAAWYPSHGIFYLVAGWSAYSMILLWLSFQASLDVPQRSSSLRFAFKLPALLRCRGVAHAITTVEISDTDAVVDCDPELVRESDFKLSIPECGLRDASVTLLESPAEGRFILKYTGLDIEQQRALIAVLYCRPGQWAEFGVPEPVTFWHFLEAPFRMYPLAETR